MNWVDFLELCGAAALGVLFNMALRSLFKWEMKEIKTGTQIVDPVGARALDIIVEAVEARAEALDTLFVQDGVPGLRRNDQGQQDREVVAHAYHPRP